MLHQQRQMTICHSKENDMPRTKGSKDKQPRNTANKINWEGLAKNLQQALAAEIKENDELRNQNTQLITQGIKLLGTIEYLESKRGNN
jgi:hypothetical protein